MSVGISNIWGGKVVKPKTGSTLLEGLVSYYKFDETGGTTANDIHGAKNGTIYNTTINQTGKIDKCYLFELAAANIRIPTSGQAIDGCSEFTVSIWFYIKRSVAE